MHFTAVQYDPKDFDDGHLSDEEEDDEDDFDKSQEKDDPDFETETDEELDSEEEVEDPSVEAPIQNQRNFIVHYNNLQQLFKLVRLEGIML